MTDRSAGRIGRSPASRRRTVAATVVVALWALACSPSPPAADGNDELLVAVAANFAHVHEELSERFAARTGVEVRSSVGSTGQLSAQIANGAPFDVFLAADAVRPRRLVEAGLAPPESRRPYALGRLALYGPGAGGGLEGGRILAAGGWRHLAIADPEIAPYGAAAVEVIERLDLRPAVADRIVWGESVGQAYQFVRSGAAELGFVSLSQVLGEPPTDVWPVPPSLHAPIVQEAVRLAGAARPDLAARYLDFLTSAEARELIEDAGYALPE